MIDWLNDNSGAVQAFAVCALVIVTALYAWFTLRMARELREQTLAQDRPDLLIDIVEAREPECYRREAQGEESQAKVEPYAYPDLICRIHNAGRHAAKEVAVTVMHPNVAFHAPRKGFLLPEGTWETSIVAYREAPDDLEPWGLSQWAAAQDEHFPKPDFAALDTGVVVYYRDIHDVDWATYLHFNMAILHDATDGKLISREVILGDQRRIRAKYRRLPPVTIWVKPKWMREAE